MPHRRAMPRVRVVPFVVMAVASLSTVSDAPAQEAAANPPLPTVSMEGFRVDVATGALTPLEITKANKEWRGGLLYCYLEGASSPVTFRQDEPLALVYRWDAARKDFESDARKSSQRTWERIRSDRLAYHLEFLFVSDNGRRYGTGKFVPADYEP